MPSSNFCRHQACIRYSDTHVGKILKHIKSDQSNCFYWKRKITKALCLGCIYTHCLKCQDQEISLQPLSFFNLKQLEATAVGGINLISALSLIRVSSFMEFFKSHPSGVWLRDVCASKYWLPILTTKQTIGISSRTLSQWSQVYKGLTPFPKSYIKFNQ